MNQILADELLRCAVLNNAEWCDIVCAAHGAPGLAQQNIWRSAGPVPHGYPGLVTLNCTVDAGAVANAINGLPSLRSLTDSFNTIDMGTRGFKKLFEAQWLTYPDEIKTTLNFKFADTADQLKKWAIARSDGEPAAIFNQAILCHPDVSFIYTGDEDEMISGAIILCSNGVAGISNFFCKANPNNHWPGCIAVAQSFTNLPVVTYESGDALSRALAIGFKPIGPLCVWERE